ncbi:hypothetical protein [Geomesophilobacter sediminis]|uniref:YtkA-like domain-containing protein n=1 Tax=Geomesophilobacter sediminis TaxID=2798584 RepID=A0A8J7M068_9BACT|nr:hypothetical protein [Geomesophilobacter sediminis]MBJ6723612.1 hypothetical protein [Geomesophilobacter sediminis]
MQKKFILALLFSLLTLPPTAFAMEQSFSQNGVKATVHLSPDQLTPGKEATLRLSLEKDGHPVTDQAVVLEVYEKDAKEPVIKRKVDVLEGEYVDSWKFEKPSDYRVVLKIAAPGQAEGLRYEIVASVEKDEHQGHGFMSHMFGGHWGWWGGALMVGMMVTMMVLL